MGVEKCETQNVTEAISQRHVELFLLRVLRADEVLEDLVKNHSTVGMEEYLRTFVQKTPLEILATVLLERGIRPETSVKLFSSYNAFLALLDDEEKRNRLKKLRSTRYLPMLCLGKCERSAGFSRKV